VKLLHIEDDETVRYYLAKIIKIKFPDTDLVSCESWTEAKNLDFGSFDLIFLDHIMPEHDGVWIFNKLRDSYTDITNKIVFITGSGLGDNLPAPTIKKPFTFDEIEEMIREKAPNAYKP